MYNRLDRKKHPPNIIYKDKGGMNDLFDNGVKDTFLITDEEYDALTENLTTDEIGLFISEILTYREAKELLVAFNRALVVS